MASLARDALGSVLRNLDILAIIFDELDWNEDIAGSRAISVCAARVCHAFASAVLPKLWRRLPNFWPLWDLLFPGDLPLRTSTQQRSLEAWSERIRTIFDAQLYQETTRWELFLRYASYVQRVDRGCHTYGESALLGSLIEYNGGRAFLPALRRLHWVELREGRAALASMASNTLLELHLQDRTADTYTSSNTMELAVALLPSHFPALRKFVYRQFCHSSSDNTAFVTSLTGCKHLRSLRIDTAYRALDYDTLRQVFAAHPLEDLQFWIRDVDDLSCPGPIFAPHLRSLNVTGPVRRMLALLPNLRAPCLASLNFNNHYPGAAPEQLLPLCTMLSQHPYSPTLTSLFLRSENDRRPAIGLIREILLPVLSMPQLERLSFVCPLYLTETVVLTDEDTAKLARALPNLKFLELSYGEIIRFRATHANAPLSAAALVHLARGCPRLEELHLQAMMDGSGALTLPALLTPTIPSHPLRLLAFRDGDSKDSVDDLDGLVRLIDRLFPKLRATGPLHVLPRSLQGAYESDQASTWGRFVDRNIFLGW